MKNYKKFVDGESKVLLGTDVIARGVDIPDVDFIIQIDPPQDPSVFIHRIGRTARADRIGKSLVMLYNNEIGYVPFMEGRGCTLVDSRDIYIDEITNIQTDKLNNLKIQCETDRAMMLTANDAFVSFFRGYSEHQLNYLFRWDEFPISDFARTLNLLRLPRMKEFLGKDIKYEWSSINPNDVPFLDKIREKQRLEKIEREKEDKQKE